MATTTRQRLSREDMVVTAVRTREKLGAGEFSLRRVAAAVPCDPMSIVHHFGSKVGLEQAMASWVEEQIEPPVDGDWRARLDALADAYRAVGLRHPETFPLLQAFTFTGVADQALTEVVHRAFDEAGVDRDRMADVTTGWFSCVIGLVVGEVRGLIAPLDDHLVEQVTALDPERFPITRALTEHYRTLVPATTFRLTLDALHAGITSAGRGPS
ncbi:TetR/AcrR family transcriptional regulator [Rhodococcoides corynebacterioides]|uniref:TetR/AcrR family transcriptional regulator n=1 Tax=Rhodococcoides corynebacterioides TaxID=53972 RepID=UPI001C9A87D8|nr:TetR/AcrR family transcriptional regulator [Rhodococcus corynebacterioides]MBY6349232.1 TetR/AcrR family transcriptional regulator C-terminal domain-containing protein [Rhodococcus corynebacterioides]